MFKGFLALICSRKPCHDLSKETIRNLLLVLEATLESSFCPGKALLRAEALGTRKLGLSEHGPVPSDHP